MVYQNPTQHETTIHGIKIKKKKKGETSQKGTELPHVLTEGY